ncbi:MAG: phosphoglycerate mutase family protein [Anaerovoracaceae bacterium]
MKTQIFLIRHGITEGNKKKWYYGASDIPLDPEGEEEILILKEEGIYPSCSEAGCYTSGLLRTEQTFSLIYGKKDHGHLAGLREMDFGEFERKSHKDLMGTKAYEQWIGDETRRTPPPGGESVPQFKQRISKAFADFLPVHCSQGNPASIIICHGGVIAAVLDEYFPEDPRNYFQWIPHPGRGYCLQLKGNKIVDFSEL